MILLYSIFANLIIQIPNIFAIHYFGYEMTVKNSMKLALYMMPISFMATIAFSLYFAKSSLEMNYPVINLINISINVIIGLIVGFTILKSEQLHWIQYIGVGLIIVGVLLIINKENIINFTGIV